MSSRWFAPRYRKRSLKNALGPHHVVWDVSKIFFEISLGILILISPTGLESLSYKTGMLPECVFQEEYEVVYECY